MARFYGALLRQAITSLLGSTGRVHTGVGLLLFLIAAFNQAWASLIVKTWNGISPWYSVGVLVVFLLYEVARVNYQTFQTARPAVGPDESTIAPGPPIPMGDGDFDREFGTSLGTAYEIIKPSAQDVFKYERRGFERVFTVHQGLMCQIVIGRSADRPDNVPLRRSRIKDDAKKVLRTAYSHSVRPDLGYCFAYDALSDNPSLRLDDGTQLEGYYLIEALKDLYGNQLAVPHPTERNLYWLTEIGKGWAQDVIDRNLV